MRGRPDAGQACEAQRIARAQLAEQVLPLEGELPTSRGHGTHGASPANPHRVETEAALSGFRMDHAQVLGDAAEGRRLIAKTIELGMMTVSHRAAAKHGLREQRFAPDRDQAPGVQAPRM